MEARANRVRSALLRLVVSLVPLLRRSTRSVPVLYRVARVVFDRLILPRLVPDQRIRREYAAHIHALADDFRSHGMAGGELDDQGDFYLRTRDGFYLYFDDRPDAAIPGDGQGLDVRQHQAPGAIETFVLSLARSGMSYVDVGANNGYFYSLKLARRGCVVHCFEPDPSIRAHLSRNVIRNGLEAQIRIFGVALGQRSGTVVLTDNRAAMGHVSAAPDSVGVSVPCERLDDLVARGDVPRIDLMKIDVEGGEHDVLRGALESLRRDRPVILLEWIEEQLLRSGSSGDALFRFFADLGYRCYSFAGTHDVLALPLGSQVALPMADLQPLVVP